MRGLIEVGVLKRDGQQWRIESDNAATDIPASIQAMLLARVDRLPQEVRRLAQEAAVIGPRFDASLLRAVAPDPARLDADLELLCDAEIIEEVAGSAASLASLPLHADDPAGRDLPESPAAATNRNARADRRRLRADICGNSPERLEDLVLLGHHLSLSAARERARATSGRQAIGPARSMPMTTPFASTSRRLPPGRDRTDAAAPAARRTDRRPVRPGRKARGRAWALRVGPAGISRGRRSHRLGADPSQDRPPALGRRQARQGRGALCRSRSPARGCRCADRAGASVAGTRPAGVSNRRQCPGAQNGRTRRSNARAPCRQGKMPKSCATQHS